VLSSGDVRGTARRAAGWLSLGAAPAFACMAVLTDILGRGAHETMCPMATHLSSLTGMVPMYALMTAFHCGPWLELIFRKRCSDEAGELPA
jgi:hypothetical protein